MMNIGIVVPADGYLQALRDACEASGAVLIFDEVKCGGTIAYGGAAERFGVQPHLAAWAKAIGGGLHDRRVRRRRRDHGVRHEGRGPAGHVQREPALLGDRPRGAHPGPDARRVRPPRQARHAARGGLQPRDRGGRPARPHGGPGREGLRVLPRDAAHQLPGLPGDPHRDLLGLLPVDGEPGHLHDARRRGAVDDLGAAHRGRHPDATSTRSGSSARSSPRSAARAPVRRSDRGARGRDRRVRARPDREPAAARRGHAGRRAGAARRRDDHARRGSAGRRRSASGPRSSRRRRSRPTTRRRWRSSPPRRRRRASCSTWSSGRPRRSPPAGSTARGRSGARTRPCAGSPRSPGSPRTPAACSSRAVRRATCPRWSRPGTRRPNDAGGRARRDGGSRPVDTVHSSLFNAARVMDVGRPRRPRRRPRSPDRRPALAAALDDRRRRRGLRGGRERRCHERGDGGRPRRGSPRSARTAGCGSTWTAPTAAPGWWRRASAHLYRGIERADSFIVDPHKWLFAPYDACALALP